MQDYLQSFYYGHTWICVLLNRYLVGRYVLFILTHKYLYVRNFLTNYEITFLPKLARPGLGLVYSTARNTNIVCDNIPNFYLLMNIWMNLSVVTCCNMHNISIN